MSSPYRVPDEPNSTATGRTELVYPAGERTVGGRRSASVARVGLVGGAVVAMTAGHPLVAGIVLFCTAAIGAWTWRRAIASGGLHFHVDRGELTITERRSRALVARMRLRDLSDVALDTKSIQTVLPGPHAVPGVQFTHSTVGPEVDVARIVLRVARRLDGGHAVIRLTDAFLPHMESMEWAGKIRVFLRSHGWTPEPDPDEGD